MKYQEVKLKFAEKSFRVDKAVCPACGIKMQKIIENKSLFDGSLTFHIIKFKCEKCKKEYLDLEQAEIYDLFLTMSKHLNNKPLGKVSKTLSEVTIS
ncbi:MAG: hypothetical protein HY514_03540 [Candidatus Aenigmarchaeota archaeon]|nr:hypothetical protein [Candidatus Aenigmarchaeota archaeon]